MMLTDEGMLLRRRAEDILDMADKTTAEFMALDEINSGDVYIGCAESYLIRHLAQIIKEFRTQYPLMQYHLLSGNTENVAERLDRGLLDFAFIVEPPLETKMYIIWKKYHVFSPIADLLLKALKEQFSHA